jgi:hypothetical protein
VGFITSPHEKRSEMIDWTFQEGQVVTAFESSGRRCLAQFLPALVDNKIKGSQFKTKGRVYPAGACA